MTRANLLRLHSDDGRVLGTIHRSDLKGLITITVVVNY